MKIKLGVLFFIFAAVTVIGVFYAKDYISYDVKKPQATLGEVKTIAPLTDVKNVFFDYNGNPYANNQVQDSISQSDDRGVLTIVHFWASWCAPCVNEIPEIIEFMKKNTAENKQIQFVAVNLDSSVEDIQKFLKSFPEINKSPFIQIWDKENILSKYFSADKLPASVFLQKDKPYRKLNGAVSWLQIQL